MQASTNSIGCLFCSAGIFFFSSCYLLLGCRAWVIFFHWLRSWEVWVTSSRPIPIHQALALLNQAALALKARRTRRDLIECFKIVTHCYNLPDIHDIINKRTISRETRGHSLRIVRTPTTTKDAYHLSNRAVAAWNCLPDSVVTAPSVINRLCLSDVIRLLQTLNCIILDTVWHRLIR